MISGLLIKILPIIDAALFSSASVQPFLTVIFRSFANFSECFIDLYRFKPTMRGRGRPLKIMRDLCDDDKWRTHLLAPLHWYSFPVNSHARNFARSFKSANDFPDRHFVGD